MALAETNFIQISHHLRTMKIKFKCLLFICFLYATGSTLAQNAEKIHFKSILIDTHNDIPTTAIDKGLSFDQSLKGITHSDLERMAAGGVDAQFFSIWCDGLKKNPYDWANREIDTVLAWTSRNPGTMMQAFKVSDIKTAVKQKKLAVLLGMEGGHMIENDLTKLEALYKRGVRYMTLTWNNSTDWATSALYETSPDHSEPGVAKDPSRQKGLTDFGKKLVQRMNELGMLVDLSHVGEQTFADAMAVTTKPVLVSHSDVYALCPHRRNLKDDQIKAVAKNGGVIQLNFYSGFLDSAYQTRSDAFLAAHAGEKDSLLKLNPEPYFMEVYLFEKYPAEVQAMRPPLSLLIDHLDYIVRLAGVDYVGLGSDFDGINSAPAGLDGVEDYPEITAVLVKRGYSKKDIEKILGGNLLRVLAANESK